MPRRALAASALLLAALAAEAAEAAPKESCLRSYEEGQVKRREGKLRDARRELVTCAQDGCPTALRKDCVRWLAEVSDEIPSVSLRVSGVDGCDRPGASLRIDGIDEPGAADGREIELDPGSHTLRVADGNAVTERTLVLSAGERHRLVRFDLAPAGTVCGARPAPPPPPPPPIRVTTTPEPRKVPTLVYVLGGVGLASAGVAGTFGVVAWNQKSDLDDCKGRCAGDDVDAMRRSFVVADVAMVMSVVSFGVAAAIYLSSR